MDLSRPYASVVPSLDGDVLRVLASSELALTGREVATRSNRTSHSGVLKVLDRLSEQGLVKRVELNRTHLYSMNRDHLAAPAVELLMDMRNTLIKQMRDAIVAWSVQPTHVSLFGSAARGDGGVESDIDLFAVRPTTIPDDDQSWRTQIEELRTQTELWTGNPVSVLETSEAGLVRLAAERRPIMDELRDDAVLLAGTDLADVLESL
jgi:predicted nucleotidyltransferase